MSDAIIERRIEEIKEVIKRFDNDQKKDCYIFNYLILQYFYFDCKEIQKCYYDLKDLVTDGANDGGIDFVYYDDENDKIIVGQSKYTEELKTPDIIEELNKMTNTVKNFYNSNTGMYNKNLKKQLQNAIDRLTDKDFGNIEYNIFTSAKSLNIEKILEKMTAQNSPYSVDTVNIYQSTDIIERIKETMAKENLVTHASLDIDKAKNFLSYENDKTEGIIVNLSSESLIKLFNKYADDGLFDLNIRKYIANKTVDNGIKKTLDHDRDGFWFLNNGLIIACTEYYIDGSTVKINDFSIVNGGQTTNLIGKYKGKKNTLFYIPCKIICEKKDSYNAEFYNKIAEATNSQKPILPRDLKSNSPEMRRLKELLKKENIALEIKRGDKSSIKNPKYKIKNDELAQFILSFVYQRPGTSRSGKKKIFDNNDLYHAIFHINYTIEEKREFLISSIDLISRCSSIISDLKKPSNDNTLDDLEKEILKNGTQIIYALLGVLYRLANKDNDENDIKNDASIIKTPNTFIYRKILNLQYDEIDTNLKDIIIQIVTLITDGYKSHSENKSLEITSVSNYFKTDKKYYDLILSEFMKKYVRRILYVKELINLSYIFSLDSKNDIQK